mgnify:CR=1 FL=1|jgi:hypothetical protein
MTKQRILDIIFVVVTIGLLVHLNWEWEHIKSFLVGGVIGIWATIKYYMRLTK